MKILHISYSDNKGGAAIAALRIVKAQRLFGIDAKMYVISKNTDLQYVLTVSKVREIYNKIITKISHEVIKILNKSTNQTPHSINFFGSGLLRYINRIDCDIVHLHWINHEMLSIKEVAKITKPVVWTFHDSWTFCGAEHHPNGMDDFYYSKDYCLKKYKGFNINRWVLKRKKRYWKDKKYYIVTPSQWETNSAKKASLFLKNKIETIPNCLDTNIFRPIDKNISKSILNLSTDKKYVLFGAYDPLAFVKGGDLLFSILKRYIEEYDKKDIELLVFGSSYQSYFLELDLPVHFSGKIYDEVTMSLIYNSAEVILIPSRMDNLPQTATESASCGLPIVCFNVGGLTDIVEHKVTGYIANRFDIEEFAQGMNWILNEADKNLLDKNAREKALFRYNESQCVESYSNVYKSVLTVTV